MGLGGIFFIKGVDANRACKALLRQLMPLYERAAYTTIIQPEHIAPARRSYDDKTHL
jgi:hypothetical protein